MIKSYLIVAMRNLAKYKGHTLINVFGLAVGMTCCLLILFYVLTELSYAFSLVVERRDHV